MAKQKQFRPMLAAPAELQALKYPLFLSPKLDGIRGTVKDAQLMSRKMLKIPNQGAQQRYGCKALEGVDGELIVGDPWEDGVFGRSSSASSKADSQEDIAFWVFDRVMSGPYVDRLRSLEGLEDAIPGVRIVKQHLVTCEKELMLFESRYLEMGYEGVMLRHPKSPYKFGRSTMNEMFLLKVKRFEDSEAEILEVIQMKSNQNAAEVNELGLMKRSLKKGGMVLKNTMGAMRVRDLHTGVEFNVSGGTSEECKWFWDRRQEVIGKIVKYKFQPTGVLIKPRFPVLLGLREEWDM